MEKEKCFLYGDTELEYLSRKDRKLAEVIKILGHPDRPVQDDVFASLINSIVGQQISTKAQKTIWNKMEKELGYITPQTLEPLSLEEIQSFGMTFRKAEYISKIAHKACTGEFDLEKIKEMTDQEAITYLSSLDGIGTWTAEMILLHCLQRKDILSYGDLAILRGMRMVYRHRNIDKKLFEKYRRRYSPYGSIASIILWKVSAGAIEGLTDPAERKRK